MLALAPQGSHQPHTPHTLVRPERQHRTASSRTDRRPPSVTTAPTDPPTTSTPAVPAAATPTVSHAQPTRPAVVAMQRLADGSLDLGSYPSTDLLRLLAALLTQITTENDKLRPEPTPHTPLTPPTDPVPDASRPPIWSHLTTASRNALGTPAATLAFHARNIPSISIEQYLLRILKYCPTTNEVFLGLLIYFDRMSKLASDCALPGSSTPHRTLTIDSYNIHRLLIAGVTVASKFFSDVFYTNSRYAKVGGLPQTELNQLELHFLLLNDFRLSIPIDEMQRYAEQLLRYSAGMSPEDAFSPSATAPPPAPAPPTEPHRPAHLQLRPNPTSPVAAGHSPGHLSTSFSASTFPKTSHHDIEGRAWNAASNSHRSSQVASDAASIYSVDASESGYGSTTDSDTIRAHWSSAESEMTEDGADRDEP